MITLSIAKEFSIYPFGRVAADGPDSAERFRKDYLLPRLKSALKNKEQLKVDLTGVPLGIGPSFLEESFGGIVRKYQISAKEFWDCLLLEVDDLDEKDEIREYIFAAESKE